MSELTTTPPVEEDETEAIAPEAVPAFDVTTTDGLALAVAHEGDARIAEDALGKVAAILSHIRDRAEVARTALVNVTNRRKEIAEDAANVRAYILTEDGTPDWGAKTKTYARLVEGLIWDTFGDNLPEDVKKQERGNIRQHVKRTYLEPAIRAYVQATFFPDVEGRIGLDVPEPDNFRFHVRKQYVSAGLAIPTAYQTPEDKAGSGGTGGGPGQGTTPTTNEVLSNALAGLPKMAQTFQADALLQHVTQFAEALRTASEVKDRPHVTDRIGRAQGILTHAVKLLRDPGKFTADDAEKMQSLYWGTEDAQ